MTVSLFDCNNYIRRQYEVDQSGLALRNIFEEAMHTPANNNIYVYDGSNAKASRREVFPGYKVGRPKASDEFYKTLDVSKKVLACTPQISVEVEGYEADDIIASIVRSMPDQSFTIYSNDGDFRRLCGPKVKMSDPTLTQVDPVEVQLYKTLVGDSSDKIPGFKGFGKESYPKLTDEQKANWIALLTRKNEIGKQLASEDLGLKVSQMPWLVLNMKELRSFWSIVGFLDVSDELINSGTKIGTPNRPVAENLLREVMQ